MQRVSPGQMPRDTIVPRSGENEGVASIIFPLILEGTDRTGVRA